MQKILQLKAVILVYIIQDANTTSGLCYSEQKYREKITEGHDQYTRDAEKDYYYTWINYGSGNFFTTTCAVSDKLLLLWWVLNIQTSSFLSISTRRQVRIVTVRRANAYRSSINNTTRTVAIQYPVPPLWTRRC